MLHNVFVYGSLKEGHWNHTVLGGAKKLSDAISTDEHYRMRYCGYPVLYEDGRNRVKGELYLVDDTTMERLDRLEGHPTFYKREVRGFILPNGDLVSASIYITQRETGDENIEPVDGLLIWNP